MSHRFFCALTAWLALGGQADAQHPDMEPVSERKSGPAAPPEPARLPTIPIVDPDKPVEGAARPAVKFGRPGPTVIAASAQSVEEAPAPLHAPKPVATGTAEVAEIVGEPVPHKRAFGSRLTHPGDRTWTRLEYLLWTASGQHVPPAITTAPGFTPANFAGIVSNPGTEVLFPADRTNNEFRGGFRLTSGIWLDEGQETGLEGDFFFLNNSKKGLTVASDKNGIPVIARPFFNVQTNAPDAILVAYPNLSFGALSVRAENWAAGGGVNLIQGLSTDPCRRLDLIFGYRYLGVYDEVEYEQDSTALAAQPGVPFATRTQVLDRFNTRNSFNGAVFGFGGERRSGFWFFGSRATIAFGGVKQAAIADGRTVITPPNGLPHATFQGLYTQVSNIGLHERTWFAIVPELNLRVGVQFSQSTRFYFGYNFIYLSSAVRAGDQVDVRVNPDFLPGGPAVVTGPRFPDLHRPRKTDFWMHGVSFGMETRF